MDVDSDDDRDDGESRGRRDVRGFVPWPGGGGRDRRGSAMMNSFSSRGMHCSYTMYSQSISFICTGLQYSLAVWVSHARTCMGMGLSAPWEVHCG